MEKTKVFKSKVKHKYACNIIPNVLQSFNYKNYK